MRGLSIRAFGIAFFITGLLFAVVEQSQVNLEMFGIQTPVQQSNSKEVKLLEQQLASAKKQIQILEEQRVAQVKPSTVIEPVKQSTQTTTTTPKEKTYTLQIYRNMSVAAIAQKLEAAGIIKNAIELEMYLARDEYNKKVQIGEFKLKQGMTIKAIADTITRNKN